MNRRVLTILVLAWLALPAVALAGSGAGEVVSLDAGRVRGRTVDGVREFLGIPYAAPPVGDLRWRAPEPPAPWPGVLAATAFGRPCPQTGPFEASCGEDCLTLNVWTPARKAGERLPVMVWIHGGGFTFGASSMEEYHGRNLAGRGVVVVTVNYRLGVMGFLAHPALARESGAGVSGNYGLLDQISALGWVRRNIAAFGGDPGQVTLFGQSAGARSVSLLTVSPLARGLFKRAIAQSGGPILGSEYLTPAFNGDAAQAAAMGRELGARLGCDKAADEAACLRSKSAADILKAADIRTSIFEDSLFFAPVFDGHVLPGEAKAVLGRSKRGVPMILGSTADEGTFYLRTEKDLTLGKYRAFLEARFGPRTSEALAVFPAASDAAVYGAVDRFVTVAVNAQPARAVARALEREGQKAWVFHFTRRPDTARAREMGAYHGVDLAYVFGNMEERDGFAALDRNLSRQVMGYWVNFAKTGDPNGPGLPYWPAYRSKTDEVLDIGDAIGVRQGLAAWECDFIDTTSRFSPAR